MNIYTKYKTDYRTNLKLAAPIMIGQLGTVVVYIADNVMVGALGAEALAAVSLSIAVFSVFMIFGMGISFALPPVVAEADGSGDDREISKYFKHSLILNTVYAIIAIIILELCLPLLYNIGQTPAVVDLAIPYLRLSAYSLLPFMLFQSLRTFSDGKSETMPPMIAMIIGNALNILLNYILIFGKWGAPELGVYGAALASLISRVVMMVSLFILVRYWKNLWHYIRSAQYRNYQWTTFKKLLNLGVPTSLQMLFEIMAFSGSTIIMGVISAQAQAAHQIALNLVSTTYVICLGLSLATTIRVGNQLGKGDIPALRNAGFSSIIQAIVFMAISGVFFILMRFFLPSLYIDDISVINLSAGLLILAAIFQIPDGVQAISIGALRGMQDITYPTVVTFVAYVLVGLPLAWIMAFNFNWGPQGVWIGLLAGLSVAALLNTLRFDTRSARML